MSMLVWVMMGIAIWHFMVFVPDRFWGGIVGAFVVATIGAALFGFIVNGLTIPGRNDTDLAQALIAVPGALIALGVSWLYGSRLEARGYTSARRPARIPSGPGTTIGRMPEPPAHWSCDPYPVAAAHSLAGELGLHPVTASILVRRGYDTPEAARRFLAAADRHDPSLMPGLRGRGRGRSCGTSPPGRGS